ncbi:LacI family DNA-binding transcriptional regulator [Roseomonas elaeocarpi]|uniref:LacI family DNA-binding transcriptional regulator n=1 Tax=Roseomonas elaeocarpi TaxID=907779 RepID=A0ABV6JWK9_9PROT
MVSELSPAAARPTVADVARHAGASTATVDRVLNGRPGVRPATAQRVLRAALELGYITEAPAVAPEKPLRLAFVLPAGSNRFLNALGRLVVNSAETFATANMQARVDHIRSFSPDLLAQHLRRSGREVDGVAFMALEHPAVREAVNMLDERGIPTVTLISDVANAPRSAYLGLDNRAAGRTAGYLIARFIGPRPAKVAMIAGSLSYRAHEEREMGFLHLFAEMFPQVEVVGLREAQDDDAVSYRQTRMLLLRYPELAGIYNIGGGAAGVGRALREARREHDVVLVGHGLTPETREMLLDGTMDAVITQNLRATLMDCISIFANLRAGLPSLKGVDTPRAEIVFRENLP